MSRCLVIITLCFVKTIACAQNDNYIIVDKDTAVHWGNSSVSKFENYYFDLPNLSKTKCIDNIRMTLDNQIIDLSLYRDSIWKGYILNYCYIEPEVEKYEYKFEGEIIFNIDSVSTSKINRIVNLLEESNQRGIPTGDCLNIWESRFIHCNSNIIYQFKSSDTLIELNYFCISGQDTNQRYIVDIRKNFREINKVFELNKSYKNFKNKLPSGKTYTNGYWYLTKPALTEEDIKRWEKIKPIAEYFKKFNDSINIAIDTNIKNTKKSNRNGLDCSCFYYLKFNKNGKLVDYYNMDKEGLKKCLSSMWYLDELIALRKYNREVKRIFGRINLKYLNLEHGFNRIIKYDGYAEEWINEGAVY